MKFYIFSFFVGFNLLNLFFALEIDFSYYHTTSQIDTIMTNLIKKCKHVQITQVNADSEKTVQKEIKGGKKLSNDKSINKDEQQYLKYYDIKPIGNSNTPKQNIFLLAGEHPRELISTELLLNFVLSLCDKNQSEELETLMSNFNFRIILNANPNGRMLVEKGEYCKRTNLNDVDINRNWDIHWGEEIFTGEENPGVKPFSESESKFIHHSIENFNAKLFLTIHSGVYGLYMPYAFLPEEGVLNKSNMNTVLNEIKEKFCPMCQLGAPSKLIGYKSSGTCLDYIYDNLKVPYSLAWEIYSNEKLFPKMMEYDGTKKDKFTITSFLSSSETSKLTSTSKINLRKTENNSFFSLSNKRMRKRSYSKNENDECASLFNPLSKLSYEFIVKNWTDALINLLEYIKAH